MRKRSNSTYSRPGSREAGMTLIETVIALAILFIAAGGLTGLAAIAVMSTENQGHLAARVAEYAQDKMEQLISLKYDDDPAAGGGSDTVTVSDTVNCVQFLVNPTCNTGGSGLAVGGISDPACGETGHPACVNKYVDYLDADGNPKGGGLTPPADWFYRRVWQIELVTANLKRVTVACKTRFEVGSATPGKEPRATLVMLKTSPF